MKIRFVDEYEDRIVDLIGKVLCTRSDDHDASWEFESGKEYNIYMENLDELVLFIVFNDKSGYYSTFRNIDDMNDTHYTFKLIT